MLFSCIFQGWNQGTCNIIVLTCLCPHYVCYNFDRLVRLIFILFCVMKSDFTPIQMRRKVRNKPLGIELDENKVILICEIWLHALPLFKPRFCHRPFRFLVLGQIGLGKQQSIRSGCYKRKSDQILNCFH